METNNFRLHILRKTLWRLACNHGGIPADAYFVVFEDKNPWIEKLNRLNSGEYPEQDLIGFGFWRAA